MKKKLFQFKKLNKQENTEEKKNKQEIKKESSKNKISNFYNQLVELQEKIEKDKLSPIRKFFIENKIARIETKLERELAKLDILQYKQLFKDQKGQIYEIYNERLQEEKNELDSIYDEIENRQILIDQKEKLAKKREKDYKKINKAGNNEKDTHKFTSDKKSDNTLTKCKQELEQLNNQKDAKTEEIIRFKEQFAKYEKELKKEYKTQLKEYKPLGFFARIKKNCQKIYSNFINMIKNYETESELIKKAREDIRTAQNTNDSKLRMEQFKSYIEPSKEEIEAKREETQRIITAQEQVLKKYIERSKELEGKEWEYRNGNYVPKQENENEVAEIIPFNHTKETSEQDENTGENLQENIVKEILENDPEITIEKIMSDLVLDNGTEEEEKTAGDTKREEKEEREKRRRKNLNMDEKVERIDHKKAKKEALRKKQEEKRKKEKEAAAEFERTGIM